MITTQVWPLVHTHPGGDANGIAHALAADAAAEDGLLGIQDQVEEHLLKLMGVAFGGGHALAVGRADANARQHELRRAQAERLLDGLSHVDGAPLRLPLAREEQQALHDLGHTATLRQHHLDGPAQVGGQVPRGEELRIAEDHGQRIVELVRHAGDQLSHGRELPRLQELRLSRLELAHALRELFVEAAVLDGERGGDGQAREAVEVGAYEPLLRPMTADRDGADELVADHQRVADHGQGRPLRIRLDDVGIPLRPGLVVVDEGARARGGGDG